VEELLENTLHAARVVWTKELLGRYRGAWGGGGGGGILSVMGADVGLCLWASIPPQFRERFATICALISN